jgi:hypothetical protein
MRVVNFKIHSLLKHNWFFIFFLFRIVMYIAYSNFYDYALKVYWLVLML